MSTNNTNLKAVAYARVSTLLNQDASLQLANIRTFAEARNLDLVEEYMDQGISGAKERRPGLDRMIVDARKGKFKVVICVGIDRLGRSTKHLLTLLDELSHYGVSLISIRENLDFTTPTGQLALTMLAAVATIERQLTSERIKTSLAAKKIAAQKGQTQWRCGRPSVCSPEIVQKVLSLRAQGLSVRRIEKALNRVISRQSVLRILKGSR